MGGPQAGEMGDRTGSAGNWELDFGKGVNSPCGPQAGQGKESYQTKKKGTKKKRKGAVEGKQRALPPVVSGNMRGEVRPKKGPSYTEQSGSLKS